MFSPFSQSVMFWLRSVAVLQTVLLLTAYAFALRKDRIYPAMRGYLLVNAMGGILVCALLSFPGPLAGRELTVDYALFWLAYGASGVLTFFTAQQIFRDALDPLPGLRRLALVAFRWVAVVSVAVSVVPAIVPLFFRAHSLEITALQAMRCVSVLEFCLVAFLLLSAQALASPGAAGLWVSRSASACSRWWTRSASCSCCGRSRSCCHGCWCERRAARPPHPSGWSTC